MDVLDVDCVGAGSFNIDSCMDVLGSFNIDSCVDVLGIDSCVDVCEVCRGSSNESRQKFSSPRECVDICDDRCTPPHASWTAAFKDPL